MKEINIISRLWAKTTHDAENYENAFHPLVCHLIDVASATQEIWEKVLPEKTKKRLAKVFELENDLNKARDLIAFLIGLHDLGKCSPPFALRGKGEDEQYLKKLLERLPRTSFFGEKVWGKYQTIKLLELYRDTEFYCTGFKTASDAPHNFVTSVVLPTILKEKYGFQKLLAENIANIIGGHHGTFPDSNFLTRKIGDEYCGNEFWREAQRKLVGTFTNLFEIEEDYSNLPNAKLDNATAMIFAGLTTTADWIGSNADFFKCEIEDYKTIVGDENFSVDLKKYLEKSKRQAAKALAKLGWMNWAKESDEKEFDELFPDLKEKHRDLQDVAIEIAKDLNEVGIAVVESPMGEGKTEAAMFLADAWNAKLGTRGVYFALPTQATSNQMFGRVEEFLGKKFAGEDVNVQLMLQHGHSSISAEFEEKIENFRNIQNISDDADKKGFSNIAAAEWFTYKKRGLLVPFGVGTVDQILLAALQTKHVFVRLFGLAHKTIIIDEVHAYDAYMSTLLERLLEWLAALGSPVVILSATLPQKKRDALVKAYLKGLGQKFEEGDELTNIGEPDKYPRISYATTSMSDKTFKIRQLQTSKQNTKTLHLEWKNEDAFVEDLKLKLANGGCAAIICNTVDRAQKLFEELAADKFFQGKDEKDNKPKLDLLHARFRFKNRDEREKRALLRFGKQGEKVRVVENGETIEKTVGRPDFAVLISTQIIEQSLDLDFDLMISELAPADLLLQRAGRLQRHNRERLSEFENKPTLWIIKTPTDANGDLLINKKGLPDFGKSGVVYDKHILLRSWLKLRNEKKIKIPDDIEKLIEDVYDNEKVFENLAEKEILMWQKTLEIYQTNCELEKDKAQYCYIKNPHYGGHLGKLLGEPKEEDAPELHPSHQAQTRDVEPTANVVCLWEKDGKLYTDETFSETISLADKPTKAMSKIFLFNSLSVSSKSVVFSLLKEEVPRGWEKSALLMRHRVLKFGANGKCEMFGYVFHLDENLGLKITKIKEEK